MNVHPSLMIEFVREQQRAVIDDAKNRTRTLRIRRRVNQAIKTD